MPGHAVRLSELAGQTRSAQRRLRRDAGWHPGLFLQEGEHIESVLLRGVVVAHGELDMPSRTTRDYREPAVAPRYQAALEAALTPQETEISVNAAPSPADARYRVKASRTEQPSG